MARIETGGTALLPAGILYRNGTSSATLGGTPLPVARRFGPLPGGRGALTTFHRSVGRAIGRPIEDHRRSESAMHDHLDFTEEHLNAPNRLFFPGPLSEPWRPFAHHAEGA